MLLIKDRIEIRLQGRVRWAHPAQERFSMSYRNGDRSRENRLRRARIARRLKINEVREAAAKPAVEASLAKPVKSK